MVLMTLVMKDVNMKNRKEYGKTKHLFVIFPMIGIALIAVVLGITATITEVLK